MNIDGDTDTIACITGMLAGAYNGMHEIDEGQLEIFNDANKSFDFDKVSEEITVLHMKITNRVNFMGS